MSKASFWHFLGTTGRLGLTSAFFGVATLAIALFEHAYRTVAVSVFVALTIATFLWGSYLSWLKEREQLVELQSKAARPQIAFSATAEPEPRWFHFKDSSVPPLFELTHLGGEAAQFIQIQPLISMHSQNVRLEFEPIGFLDAAKRNIIPSFRLLLSGKEINPTDKVRNVGTVFFHADAANNPHLHTLEYPVTIKFKWRNEWQQDAICLTWNSARQTLATSPLD